MTSSKPKSGVRKKILSNPTNLKKKNVGMKAKFVKAKSFNSILNKEMSAKQAVKEDTKIKAKDNNKEPTIIQEKQFEELKQHVLVKEKEPNLIQQYMEEFKELEKAHESHELLEAAISKLVKAVSNKFDEYIIDEDEIFDILTAVDLILKQERLFVNDKIDIWYKYAKLYFKQSNKQESIGSHEQDVGADK